MARQAGRGGRRPRRRHRASLPRGGGDRRRRAAPRAARGTLAVQDHPGPVRLGAEEQGRPADARRGHRLPARRRSTCRRSPAPTRARGERGRAPRRPDEPFAALAFKIVADPFVGKLAFFRVYSGTLKTGSYVYNSTKGEKERIGRLLSCTPTTARRSRRSAPATSPPRSGLKDTFTGDTLCDEAKPIVLESITFPEPVIELAVEPKTKADQDKMAIALAAPGRGGPDLPRQHRRGDRPDPHRRHGRAAPRGDRRPHAARVQVQANVGRPQVATARRSRKRGRGARAASCARPAARASTATSSLTLEPLERGTRLRVRVRRSSAARCRASTRRPIEQGVARGAGGRRHRRLPGGRRQGHRSSTARTTRSTQRRWRSRSPARMAAKDGVCEGRARRSSSR